MNAFSNFLDPNREERLRELLRHWARKPRLTVHEASALLSGIIPTARWEFDDVFSNRISFGEAHDDRYLRNHDLLQTECLAGRFGYLIPIESLLAWARYNDVSINLDFAAAVLEINAHREKVRSELAPKEESPSQSEKPLSTRERDTFLTLIAAMSVSKYGYDPGQRNGAVAEIDSDIKKLGMDPLSDDTIRNKLREASEIVPGRVLNMLQGAK